MAGITALVVAALIAAFIVNQPQSPSSTTSSQTQQQQRQQPQNQSLTAQLTSIAFGNNTSIPDNYTCKGASVSPPLLWTVGPQGTKSYVLIVDDPDAPRGVFTHWVIFNIPPSVSRLDENIPKNATVEGVGVQGVNGARSTGYTGPCPPSGTHHYIFTLYALDTLLDTAPKSTKEQVLDAMKGHVLSTSVLVGLYSK
ncbi:MAG: YbhB/YbcL family Raf kinase inhibitor-like protein [Thaumarchaeota archaeon]|nr:YbhB/YbcL family Raf kinase inhibitor-like protein [Nitrososphaerota archaeon]MCL5317423.1 YbhB/YbcL family Raf kinase inhibitor-like protein [Nitrososphaerota archaeon]